MCTEEGAPGGRAFRTWRDALGLQDAGNRGPSDTMTKILERSLDARVPPARIVRRHPDNQASDLNQHSRSARPPSREGPLPRNQIAMPSENGVGRDERRNFSQHAASESLPQHGEPSALTIVQPEPLAAQLRLERAVLFAEEGDHIALLALKPAKQRRQQHLQRNHR